jgi:hypothetical protein
MDAASITAFAKEFGPWVVLCGFLVWQSWRREQRMAKRLDHVEDQIREHLVRVIEKNTMTMAQVLAALRDRPCLVDTPNQRQTQAAIPPDPATERTAKARAHG